MSTQSLRISIRRIDPDRWPAGGATGQLEKMFTEIRESFMPPHGCFLLAAQWESPIVIAGTAAFRRQTADICEVRRFVVGWDYQRGGIGQLMLRALVDQARLYRYRVMRAEVPMNVPALASFYQKQGFCEVSPYRITSLDEAIFFEKNID